MQSVSESLPAGASECSGHESHAGIPTAGAYVFTAHAVHASPSGPKNPGRHLQSFNASLPGGACVC